jgi:hypothetical protein
LTLKRENIEKNVLLFDARRKKWRQRSLLPERPGLPGGGEFHDMAFGRMISSIDNYGDEEVQGRLGVDLLGHFRVLTTAYTHGTRSIAVSTADGWRWLEAFSEECDEPLGLL